MRTILLLLLLLGWPAWAGATVWFDDSFEGASPEASGWAYTNSWCNNSPCAWLDVSTDLPHSGSKSLKLTYDSPTEDIHTTAIYRPFTAGLITSSHVFIRYWYRTSGFTYEPSNGTKHGYVISRDDKPSFFFINWFGSRAITMADQFCGVTFDNNCHFYANAQNVPLNDNQWYCIEHEIQQNSPGTANGTIRTWVGDGINQSLTEEYLNYQGADAGTNSSNPLYLLKIFRQAGGGIMYYDQVAVGDARISCAGGTPSPVDTTPPAPVQGLAAVENVSGTGTITWQATTDSGSSGLASYTLVRCTGAACTPTVTLTTTGLSAVSYSDVGLAGSTTYGYAIRATDNAGNSTTNTSPPVYITTNAQVAGALSLDAVSSSPDNITLGTVSWPHTIGSVNNRLLAVCTQARDANSVDANVGVSSVTFDGVALTHVPSSAALRSDTTNRYGTDLWYLINPAIGTGTIAVVFGGTPSRYGVASGTSFSGVHQTTPIDATAVAATGSGTTLSAAITSATNDAMIMDCAIGGDPLTVGAGQTNRTPNRIVGVINASNDGAGVSTVSKATAGAETMDWTMLTNNWAMSTVVWKPTAVTVEPLIASLALDATGATVTTGATAPTSYRVATHVSNIIYAAASFPGGRFTAPGGSWPPALQQSNRFVCIFAINASGVENILPSAYQCGVPPVLAAIDTAVPVMTLLYPLNPLPFGQTSVEFAIGVDKAVPCRFHTSDTTYALMPNDMTTASLTASATKSGLSTGTITLKARCNFTDVLDVEHPNLTSLDIPITVEASTADTTPPATVSGLTATALPNAQVQLDWSAVGGDTVGYQGYLCQGVGCSTMLLTGLPVSNTQLIVALGPVLPYSFCVKAIDSSNNLSAACSTLVTLTTSALSDLVPPSTMANLRVYGSPFTNAVVLTSDPGTDDRGPVTTVIELSTTGCGGPFSLVYTNLTLLAQVNNLTSSTAYCARGAFSDGTWLGGYSNTLAFTTAATGLMYPRFPVPFSQPRTPIVIPRSGLSRDRTPKVP